MFSNVEAVDANFAYGNLLFYTFGNVSGWSETLRITGNGNVGIGTTRPGAKLELNAGTNDGLRLNNGTVNGVVFNTANSAMTVGTVSNHPLYLFTNNSPAATILPSGNVGIGTTSPGSFKLAVEGKIGAREIVVTSVTPWPDYVFAPNYHLKPLSEVAAYIRQNHHLPEIPTEAEVKENGVGLGEMQSKLLAKIEELTLHMIAAEERSGRLEGENRQLQQRIARLEGQPGQ